MSIVKFTSEFGGRLKAARERKGWKQPDLSRQSGVPQATISQAEQGKRDISPEKVAALARALDVSLDYLLTGTDPTRAALGLLGLPVEPATPGAPPMSTEQAKAVIAEVMEGIRRKHDDAARFAPDELPQPIVRFASSLDQAAAVAGARTEDFVAVPLLEDAVAAGAARVMSDQVEGWAWVYGPLLGRRSNLVAVRIAGDSMEPVLPAGAVVVVDRGDRRITPRGVYLVKADGGCTVKRLEFDGQELVLIPENREHREVRVPIAEGQETPVVGRVVFSWRTWAPPDPEDDGAGAAGEKRAKYRRGR